MVGSHADVVTTKLELHSVLRPMQFKCGAITTAKPFELALSTSSRQILRQDLQRGVDRQTELPGQILNLTIAEDRLPTDPR